jgi:hypothetical protein
MKRAVAIATILCILTILPGQVEAQQPNTFGTKVGAMDSDVGYPLSNFANIGTAVGGQANAWVAYWDIGANPGIYDDKDVAYLQFGSFFAGANKIVMANNIRLTGWGAYPTGSYVKAGDSDIGQQVIPLPGFLPSGDAFTAPIGFYYMNVAGSSGYDLEDPVYLKAASPPGLSVQTNDVRITANAGYMPGSRVSNNEIDSGKPLSPFKTTNPPLGSTGGPIATTGTFPVAQLAFFNTNGDVDGVGNPIYDEGDLVYLDIAPLNVVSPNDIRLF